MRRRGNGLKLFLYKLKTYLIYKLKTNFCDELFNREGSNKVIGGHVFRTYYFHGSIANKKGTYRKFQVATSIRNVFKLQLKSNKVWLDHVTNGGLIYVKHYFYF